jgi:signal transduction histidine kinase
MVQREHHRKQLFLPIYGVLLLALLVLIGIKSIDFIVVPQSFSGGVKDANQVIYQVDGGDPFKMALPGEISDLDPHTPVRLQTTIDPTHNDSILIETIYTALRLYADDVLIYECGFPGTYPAFLVDPPTIITTVALPDSDAPQLLRFEYISPGERSTMSLPALEYGPETALLSDQFREYGFSFFLSIFFLLIGMVTSIIAFFFSRKTPAAAAFIPLGLFALAIGTWSFGECPFTAFLFPHPGTLYLMSYCGLYILGVPFFRFLELALRPHHTLPFRILQYILCAVIFLAFLLQFLGQVSLARNLYVYEIVIPIMLLIIMGLSVHELIRYRNPSARRFIIPTISITIFALLAILNYQLRFIESIIFIFQVGAFIFVIQLGAIGVTYVREASRAFSEKKILEVQIDGMNRQLDVQRKQYSRLTKNSERVRAMQHDLRHQLTALRHYSETDDKAGLERYLGELSKGLPLSVTDSYCQNYAVNAVAGYYLTLAVSEGVRIDVRLDIPEDTGAVQDMDLCVIIGNLIENAVESLRRIKQGDKYIKAHARRSNGMLSIIVENNFDGVWTKDRDHFLSRKTEEDRREGVGLSSVKAVCERYDGLFRTEISDTIWRVSALVKLSA